MTHSDKKVCLKEIEWRDVRDFMSGTKEYRIHLDATLGSIKTIALSALLAILVPSIIFWVQLGEMKRQVNINTERLDVIESVLRAK